MRIVRERERAQITGIPKSTWYYLKNRKGVKLPESVPIAGTNAVGWVDEELYELNRRTVEAARGGDGA